MCVFLLFCDYCLVLRREKEETFNETLRWALDWSQEEGKTGCWIRLEIDFLYFSTRLEKRYREKGEENMKTLSSFLTGFIWFSSDSFLSFVLLVFVDSSTFCSSTHSKMFSWLSTCTGWRNESENSRVECWVGWRKSLWQQHWEWDKRRKRGKNVKDSELGSICFALYHKCWMFMSLHSGHIFISPITSTAHERKILFYRESARCHLKTVHLLEYLVWSR